MAQQIRTQSKAKDANVAIYSFSNKPDTFIGYKLLNDNSFINIDHTPDSIELAQDFTATSFRTPNENCIICALYRGEAVCFNVGVPNKRFVYYAINENRDIEYTHLTIEGDDIATGVLDEAGSGFYYLNITITEPLSIVLIDSVPFVVKTAIEETTVQPTAGVIKIQNNVWQLIAIPRDGDNVKEYFCDRLAAKYNANAADMIEVCSAFFGNENRFRSYIPDVTKASTSNNFPLVFKDGAASEVTGFWVKTKDLTGIVNDIDNITLSWTS
jgi:hypothetical protein